MRLLLTLWLAIGLARAAPSSAFDHEAYVWQRHWTPELAAATASASDLFSAYRVLVGEVDARGVQGVAVDWSALGAARRPVTLVLRIPGAAPDVDPAAATRLLINARAAAVAARVTVAGIEIDHDCARARLPAYARLLRELRGRVDAPTWSITALPDWLHSDVLSDVLAEVDASVLQVHAVMKPGAGLFDAAQALRWIRAYARATSKPFRVALPAYATRVTQAPDGRIRAIESDAATMPVFDEAARELAVDPRRVAVVLRRLHEATPPRFDGIVWFRLPLVSDRRAWSIATVRALAAGEDVDRPLRVERVRVGAGPNVDVVLRNDQSIDVRAPANLALPAYCRAGEGVAGYRFDAERRRLDSSAPPLLKPGASRTIAWLHCQGSETP